MSFIALCNVHKTLYIIKRELINAANGLDCDWQLRRGKLSRQ